MTDSPASSCTPSPDDAVAQAAEVTSPRRRRAREQPASVGIEELPCSVSETLRRLDVNVVKAAGRPLVGVALERKTRPGRPRLRGVNGLAFGTMLMESVRPLPELNLAASSTAAALAAMRPLPELNLAASSTAAALAAMRPLPELNLAASSTAAALAAMRVGSRAGWDTLDGLAQQWPWISSLMRPQVAQALDLLQKIGLKRLHLARGFSTRVFSAVLSARDAVLRGDRAEVARFVARWLDVPRSYWRTRVEAVSDALLAIDVAEFGPDNAFAAGRCAAVAVLAVVSATGVGDEVAELTTKPGPAAIRRSFWTTCAASREQMSGEGGARGSR